jgi:hypothetical protein
MNSMLIKAAILFAAYKFAPHSAVKAAVLGVAGVMAVPYIPYLNGKNLKNEAV